MKRLALITVILGSALALVPLASAAVLLDGGNSKGVAAVATTTDPAIQAVLLREAVAAHNGTAATQAVELRSQGLSNYYSANAVTLKPDVLGGNGTAASTSISTGDAINWNDTLAVALAGMLLLAIAATAMTRRRHQPSF